MGNSDTPDDLPGGLSLALAIQEGNWPHTMDAQAWATAWMLQLKETPEIYRDEGAMLGWFANAIMAGHDRRALELAAKDAELAECKGHIEHLDRLHEQSRAQVLRLEVTIGVLED